MSKTKLLVHQFQNDIPNLQQANGFLIISPSPERKNQFELQKKLRNYFISINCCNHDYYGIQQELPINISIQLTQLRKELKNPQNKDALFLENQQISIQQIDDIVFSDE